MQAAPLAWIKLLPWPSVPAGLSSTLANTECPDHLLWPTGISAGNGRNICAEFIITHQEDYPGLKPNLATFVQRRVHGHDRGPDRMGGGVEIRALARIFWFPFVGIIHWDKVSVVRSSSTFARPGYHSGLAIDWPGQQLGWPG